MANELRSSGHTVGETNLHLQFTPAYRREIFTDRLVRELTVAYLMQRAKEMKIENAAIVVPTEKLNIVKNDPKDNKFFEVALAGNAAYIVSLDKKHVLSLVEFKGIKTIHPEEFVKLL